MAMVIIISNDGHKSQLRQISFQTRYDVKVACILEHRMSARRIKQTQDPTKTRTYARTHTHLDRERVLKRLAMHVMSDDDKPTRIEI